MTKRDYTKTIEKRKETNERHARMRPVTREVKIKVNNLTRRYNMNRLFLEGKWTYNYYLQLHKDNKLAWSKIPTKDNGIIVKTPAGWETRTLYTLTSSMKQGIRDRLKTNEKSMIENIKRGHIIHGELHYITNLDSIPLKAGCREGEKMQSYRLMNDHKHVRFQGDDRSWKIYGGEQIPKNAELANGKLVRRGQDYYLQITFYVEWDDDDLHDEDDILERAFNLDGDGLDFGIETNVALSTGEKMSWYFEETDRLKEAQAANERYRAWHKKKYGWERNSNAQLRIINHEYEKIRRRKQDAVNKFCHEFRRTLTVVQEEQIKSWHADERYSDTVQHSIMGGIMKRLSQQSSTLVVLKWVRTTGVCPDCGHALEEKPSLDQREWDCPECGAHHGRDVAAARVIFLLGVVSLLYPYCPSGLGEGVWLSLLGVLGLVVPVLGDDVLSGSGRLKPERLGTLTGIEH